MDEKIVWQDYEHYHIEKGSDWYWATGIISGAIIVASVIFGNILFGTVVLLSIVSVFIQVNKKPRIFNFELNKKGLVIGKTLYTYDNLESFHISDENNDNRLLIKSKKIIVPMIVVPIANVDHEKIKLFLQEKILEEELHEPILQKVAEYFGF